MAISRRIIEAHDGRIAVGSNCQGAEIIVTLPNDEPHGAGP
jgi:signal transduction histidine kinase